MESAWDSKYASLQATLKELRVQAGITQLELAKCIGKPQSYVSKYESGERKLDFIEVRSVSRCLGLTLEDFVKYFEGKLNE